MSPTTCFSLFKHSMNIYIYIYNTLQKYFDKGNENMSVYSGMHLLVRMCDCYQGVQWNAFACTHV